MQRKIQFYLIHEDNQFKLRVVQVERWAANQGRRDMMFAMLFSSHSSMHQLILDQFVRFNRLNQHDQITHNTIGSFLQLVEDETIEDRYHQNSQFKLSDSVYELIQNPYDLLMLLGALDSAVHSYELNMQINTDRFAVIDFCETVPDFSNKFQLCHDILSKPVAPEKKGEVRLSRFIAVWMKAELEKLVSADNTRQLLLSTLDNLLASPFVSLTPAIREQLYPSPTVSALIEKYFKTEDALMKELLDPQYPHAEKTQKMILFIKNKPKLRADPKVMSAACDVTLDELKRKNEAISTEIKQWFGALAEFRRKLWHKIIESRLYGKPANDKGFYTNNYTEINLLKQAEFVMNSRGMIELCYFQTASYAQNYKEGRRLFDKLEVELRESCADLNLEFLPGQDFHVRAVFDAASSDLLKSYGFHYSEQFCKEQLRNEHMKIRFNSVNQDKSRHAFSVLPADLKNLMLVYLSDAYRKAAELQAQADEREAKKKINEAPGIRLIGFNIQ